VRRRVRVVHAISLQLVRADLREQSQRAAEGGHPRQRAEPHRPGHRVRLLLLPRGFRAEGRRPRDRDDQLQSGNGLDRLRHGRSSLLPAAHVRGRDGGHRNRRVRRRGRVVPRAVRRADAAQAVARPASSGRTHPRDVAGLDRSGGGSETVCRPALEPRHHAAGERHRDLSGRRARWRLRLASRSSSGRRTCSADGEWRSCTTSRRSIGT